MGGTPTVRGVMEGSAISKLDKLNLPPLLAHVLAHGRIKVPALTEQHLDPDAAWRQNRPLQIKRGATLFNFKGLPKPDFGASSTGDGALPPAAGSADQSAPTPAAPAAEAGDATAPASSEAESSGAAAAASSKPGATTQAGRALSNGRKRKAPDAPEEPPQRPVPGA